MRLKNAFVLVLMILVLSSLSLMLCATASAQTAAVTADFGSRMYTAHRIPGGMFNANGVGTSMPSASSAALLTQAGFSGTRTYISLAQVYATTLPDWTAVDKNLTKIEASGMHTVVTLFRTPKWLQITPNPCLGTTASSASAPTNVWQWGQIAASFVAHVDRAFPGLIRDYEIWNEPELDASLCVPDHTDTTRLKTYLAMYAAAASKMHAQAALDGLSIRVGGPVVCENNTLSPEWIQALLSNAQTAPQVDFVSFHFYLVSPTDIRSGMTWSTLYSKTQSTRGPGAIYTKFANLVRNGSQPNPQTTPVYMTEYNTAWVKQLDCCSNNPTFGPLWNSTFIADLLNSVYNGAPKVPNKLVYFAASSPPKCLLGAWDSLMDCASTVLDPYPQYYAYELFASTSYAGLEGGGYMAASVSPGTTQSGLMATAFYTSSKDVVVIINPTSTSYSQVSVTLKNPGFSSPLGSQHLLNRTNRHITTQTLPLSHVTGGYHGTVIVPAYSTVAVELKP